MKREDALQKSVARLLDSTGLDWFHPANGEARNAITGAKLKAMGVKAGVPDVMIFQPFTVMEEVPMLKARCFTLEDMMAGKKSVNESRIVCGLAIELKAIDAKGKRPKPRPTQLEWHERLRRCGWRVEVCYTIDEVLAVLHECYPARLSIPSNGLRLAKVHD